LDALGFIWDPWEDDWRQGLAALEEFVRRQGHARVPHTRLRTASGSAAGATASGRDGGAENCPLSGVMALEAFGFVWNPFEDDWRQGIAALEKFVRSHGHARMPAKYVAEKGFRLGNWCDNRRQERKRGKLTAERIAALDALGFVWEPQRQSARLS
jgi:hypothetical protein